MFCIICGSRSFKDFRGRTNVHCAGCGSLERHRCFSLLTLDLIPELAGRRIHVLSSAARDMQLILRLFPEAFTVATPPALVAQERIDALFLRDDFEALAMPVDQFFQDVRRKISPGGVIAFTYSPSPEGAPYDFQKTEDPEGKPQLKIQFGPGATEWFKSLPDWNMSIWDPRVNFGAGADPKMGLRYNPNRVTSNRIVLARPKV